MPSQPAPAAPDPATLARIAAARALAARFANDAREALRAATPGSVAVVSDGGFACLGVPAGVEGLRTAPPAAVQLFLRPWAGLSDDLAKEPPEGFAHLVVFVEGRPALFFAQVDDEPRGDGRARVGSA